MIPSQCEPRVSKPVSQEPFGCPRRPARPRTHLARGAHDGAAAPPAGAGPGWDAAGLCLARRVAEDAQRGHRGDGRRRACRVAPARPGAWHRFRVPAAGFQLVLDGRAPGAHPARAEEPGHPVLPARQRSHRPCVPARGTRRRRARRARAHPGRRSLHRQQRQPAAGHRRVPERRGAAVQPVSGRARADDHALGPVAAGPGAAEPPHAQQAVHRRRRVRDRRRPQHRRRVLLQEPARQLHRLRPAGGRRRRARARAGLRSLLEQPARLHARRAGARGAQGPGAARYRSSRTTRRR